jgi:hypothetical protein
VLPIETQQGSEVPDLADIFRPVVLGKAGVILKGAIPKKEKESIRNEGNS